MQVVTWGNPDVGGDSSSVSDQLKSGVLTITSNEYAFAALKDLGQVVTWGEMEYGGSMGESQAQVQSGVKVVFSHHFAFAALTDMGRLLCLVVHIKSVGGFAAFQCVSGFS